VGDDRVPGDMRPQDPQCPSCGGTYEHDQDCELRELPILLADRLGLEEARRKVQRRTKRKP
jgi:hypothetical protein